MRWCLGGGLGRVGGCVEYSGLMREDRSLGGSDSNRIVNEQG